MMIDSEMQADVDAQLLERGAFTALEWLIDSGRLTGADYEDWRRGELRFLDSALMGSKQEVRSQLQAAADYALRLGLVAQRQDFDAWSAEPKAATTPLHASADLALHELIASRYLPAASSPQMDLFVDNRVVAIVNGLVRALSARDLGESRRQLDRLYAEAPTHADLGGFDRLLACLDRLAHPLEDLRAELASLSGLRSTAQRLLGFQARDLLVPAWRRIAAVSAGRPYDPAADELHCSFAHVEAQDWRAACDSILAEPLWPDHPSLCVRLAISAYHCQHRSLGVSAWMQLCWRAPAAGAAALEARSNCDVGTTALWERYLECAESVALDAQTSGEPELGPAEFPAWLLLQEPGLAIQLPAALAARATPAEDLFRLVHDWVHARRGNRPNDELALRKSLRTASPGLFRALKRSLDGTRGANSRGSQRCDRAE
jgi:hypothetical protein